MVAYTCSSRIQKFEAGELQALGQIMLHIDIASRNKQKP